MGGTVSTGASAFVGLVWLAAPALAEAPREAELETLRKDWHGCVRQAFSSQPANTDKKAAQRAALAKCKASENAVVAAELSVQQEAEEVRRKAAPTGGLTTRARAWMSSVAGAVVDPVLSWMGR